MNSNKLISLIDVALKEADVFTQEVNHENDMYMRPTKEILFRLRQEAINNPDKLSKHILKGMWQVAALSVKEYENSTLETAIDKLCSYLYDEEPRYKKIGP